MDSIEALEDTTDLQHVTINKLELIHKKSVNCKRFYMIFDKKGTVGQFYNYNGHTVDIHKWPILVQMGKSTKDECMEQVRKALVGTMIVGKVIVMNCSRLCPDFENEWTQEGSFPAVDVLTYSKWMERPTYIKIVKEDENRDLQGNKGQYIMEPDFSICVLFNYESDEKMQKQISSIPDNENYMKFMIE